MSDKASTLPRKTATASHIMITTIREHGMEIAVGEGKTAIVMSPRGQGALTVRRSFFSQEKAVLPVFDESQTFMVPLVHHYKHLGGQVTAGAGMMLELQSRCKKAKAIFWRAARQVFRSKHLSLQLRKQLFTSCVMSTWFWGCGAWPALNKTETKYFESTTWQLWALLLPPRPPDADFWTHSGIQLALEVPSPLAYLHEARLRHLGLLVKSGPQALWTLILHDQNMRVPLRDSLQWFVQALEDDCELNSLENWGLWEDLMMNNPARWKRLVAIAASRHLKHELRLLQVSHWYKELSQILQQHGLFDFPQDDDQVSLRLPEYCLVCAKHFTSRRAWFLHAHVVHGYQSMHGRVARGDTCFVCSKKYPSNGALMHHLRYSSRCCMAFAMRDSVEDQQPVPQETQHRQCPWRSVELDGQTPCNETVVDFEAEALHAQLNLVWENMVFEGSSVAWSLALANELIVALHCILPLPKIRFYFDAWLDKFRPLNRVLNDAVPHVVAWFAGFCAVPGARAVEKALLSEEERHRCRIAAASPSPWGLLPVEMYFLHFFSGRRRSTDLQSSLERLTLPDGHQMWILSLDLQICEKRCNLLLPEHQRTWIEFSSYSGFRIESGFSAFTVLPPSKWPQGSVLSQCFHHQIENFKLQSLQRERLQFIN